MRELLHALRRVYPLVVGNGARRSRRFEVARSSALAEHAKFVGLLTPKRPEGRAPRSRQLADALTARVLAPGRKKYWIGDPANKALEILTLEEGRYELHCCAEEKGKLTSLVLAGLEFDLTEIQ